MTIWLRRPLPADSSTLPGSTAGHRVAPLCGLAPNGVWPAGMSPCRWWALTPPFHPYPNQLRQSGRCSFCATFRRIAPPGCYPALCPVELGLSSCRPKAARGHPTHSPASVYPFAADTTATKATKATADRDGPFLSGWKRRPTINDHDNDNDHGSGPFAQSRTSPNVVQPSTPRSSANHLNIRSYNREISSMSRAIGP